MIRIGLEAWADPHSGWRRREERLGLLLNSASVDGRFRPAERVVADAVGDRLRALFGPQHGVRADVQDNMVESPHGTHPELQVPIWSLYADRREPDPAMLEDIDVLLVDLQDVGCRVYTFIWTLLLVMRTCGQRGVRVVVLDRPNPLGGREVEGNLLRPAWRSFVGLAPVPMRHGLTVGELARWFVRSGHAACELEVVPMDGWTRSMEWPGTGRPWVMPSPNMPTCDTARVYPGTVLLEGTTASEGRGTTRPFEILGGPWVDSQRLADELSAYGLQGVVFRPCPFQPTFQKWAGRPCGGIQLHVTDPSRFRPYLCGVAVLRTLWERDRTVGFEWRAPPYEYETEKLPIHLLLGDERIREGIEAGADLPELQRLWLEDEEQWREEREACLLY